MVLSDCNEKKQKWYLTRYVLILFLVLFTAGSVRIMMTNEIYINKNIKHLYIISNGIMLDSFLLLLMKYFLLETCIFLESALLCMWSDKFFPSVIEYVIS